MTARIDPQLFDPTRWEGLLADIARRHEVPGIVAGVVHVDPVSDAEQRFVAATGISNLRTGVATDRTTLCQIGSITKLLTATMIMQLVDEGKLDLTTPVSEILPDLSFAELDPAELTVKKYVATLSEAKSLFSPGTGFSYCNSGLVIAGRIIEVLDGVTWDQALHSRICLRLGNEHMFTLAEDILSHRHQHGHVAIPGTDTWMPAPVSQITRSMGPAGLVTCSADDLLGFGAAVLRSGRTSTGVPILSEESLRLMSEPRHTLIDEATSTAPQWGLGWMLDEWEGQKLQWHGGTTIGNNAWFQVLPASGLTFVVFCNGGIASHAAAEIYGAFARTFAGIDAPPATRPRSDRPAVTIPESRLGDYADASTALTVERTDDGTYRAHISTSLGEGDEAPVQTMDLLPSESDTFVLGRPDARSAWMPLAFAEVDGREVAYVGIRCLPRAEAGPDSTDTDEKPADAPASKS
ncbi:serine hydrolase domain-containing protein [Brevibacterium atlanticum]|uniref:serine hydrolase domain-containing protein n=1 Tax=Brevibacterium atlanticum TaxID=2697563 RepID=UPI001424A215|nr:serine hydrolase domain-containing protein [Brevibacterium atlanticum]